MSRNAEAWFYDECDIRGNTGWVLIDLCYHAGDDGFTWPSKTTIARHARLSEATVWRILKVLTERGELRKIEAEADAPQEWRDIRADRRPTLFLIVGYAGSRFAIPRKSDGVATGSRKRGYGVATGSRRDPADLRKQNAILNEEITLSNAREADPGCVRCHGKGRLLSSSPGPDKEPFDLPCPCTDPDYERAPSRATRPVVGFGMPADRRRTSVREST